MLSEQFLALYNEELRYLRESGQQFAATHPQVAQHLGMHADGVLDPFVERLLEGTAFLSSRIQERLNNEQPEFALQMLSRLAPLWYTPLPSIATIAITPDLTSPQWHTQATLPKGSKVTMTDPSLNNKSACFVTGRTLNVQPLSIEHAECLSSSPSHLPESVARHLQDGLAHISLRLTTHGILPIAELDLDPLQLTLTGDSVRANQLLTMLLNHSLRVIAWTATDDRPLLKRLEPEQITLSGLHEDEALLPSAIGELPGSRLLREYFATPSRFFSIELQGLNSFLRQASRQHTFEILFVLEERPLSLIDRVTADDFRLFATPVINLHRRHCDPVLINSERTEHAVIVDRLNPRLYEIHHILQVDGLLNEGGHLSFSALHGDSRFDDDQEEYRPGYAIRRRKDPANRQHKGGQLPCDDMFISLSPGASGLNMDQVRSLVIQAMVCDRHLVPSTLQQPIFQLDTALPVRRLEMLRHPSNPRPVPDISLAWQALRILGDNPLRHAFPHVDNCAPLLRDWLTLFCQSQDTRQEKRIASLTLAKIEHHFERYRGPGPIAWIRGAKATLNLRSDHHADQGAFLFGYLLHQALSHYCELGQSLRLNLSVDGEPYARWEPIRHG